MQIVSLYGQADIKQTKTPKKKSDMPKKNRKVLKLFHHLPSCKYFSMLFNLRSKKSPKYKICKWVKKVCLMKIKNDPLKKIVICCGRLIRFNVLLDNFRRIENILGIYNDEQWGNFLNYFALVVMNPFPSTIHENNITLS